MYFTLLFTIQKYYFLKFLILFSQSQISLRFYATIINNKLQFYQASRNSKLIQCLLQNIITHSLQLTVTSPNMCLRVVVKSSLIRPSSRCSTLGAHQKMYVEFELFQIMPLVQTELKLSFLVINSHCASQLEQRTYLKWTKNMACTHFSLSTYQCYFHKCLIIF